MSITTSMLELAKYALAIFFRKVDSNLFKRQIHLVSPVRGQKDSTRDRLKNKTPVWSALSWAVISIFAIPSVAMALPLHSYGAGKPCGESCVDIGSNIQTFSTGVSVGGVPFVLTYNSSLYQLATGAGMTPSTFGQSQVLSPFWSSNFHRKLRIDSAGAAVQAFRGDSFVLSYIRNSAGVYVPDADVTTQLATIAGGYRLTTGNSIETYDSTGALTSIEGIDGAKLTLAYSSGLLSTVTDTHGQSIGFSYTGSKLSSVTAPDSKVTSFAYNAAGNLSQITWPDTKSKSFVYEHPTFNWAMTGYYGEDGLRKQTNSYDDAGFLAYSEQGAAWIGRRYFYTSIVTGISYTTVTDGGTGLSTNVYGWISPLTATVITSTGSSVEYTTSVLLGMPKNTKVTGSPGAGSDPRVVTRVRDAIGNITSSDAGDGFKTCFSYDALHRVKARITAVASAIDCTTLTTLGSTLPSGTAATYTTYDVKWMLPVKVTSNTGIVDFVYNGATDPIGGGIASCATGLPNLSNGSVVPVLCKRYLRAVTSTLAVDTTVPTASESFVYDNKGHVTSYVDKAGANTTFVYNAAGFLQKITDPLGFYVTYDSYDAAGRLLRTTSKTGVLTVNTYGTRGQLETSTVTPPGKSAQLTQYTTNPTGTIANILYPNGVQVVYTYDSSDRLTKYRGADGIVNYTLDLDGNVTKEAYTDLSNNPLKTIDRVYDQVGRIAKLVGASN